MTTKGRLAAAAVLLLAVVGAWLAWPGPEVLPSRSTDAEASAPAALTQAPLGGQEAGAAPSAAAPAEREAVTSAAAAPTTGTVIAHVRWGDDHAAAGITVTLRPRGCDPRYEGRRQRTDATGTVRYEGVPPGRLHVGCQRSLESGQRIELAAGQTIEVELDLAAGLTVTGIVLDADRVPVPGALVEVAMMGLADSFPEIVAVSGADGRFAARACPQWCLVGARAFGHTA
ncbi:MAG: carboxypeptidase regulatory-like domain-containing protein [Planctomycetes bacterium]|nr:carboxypeptidase regulatory-like domain-containing protein [Planctomycetota bacterium]